MARIIERSLGTFEDELGEDVIFVREAERAVVGTVIDSLSDSGSGHVADLGWN